MISGGYDGGYKSDILLFNTKSNSIEKVNQAPFGFSTDPGWTYLERDGVVLSFVKCNEGGKSKYRIIRIGTSPKSIEIVYDDPRGY